MEEKADRNRPITVRLFVWIIIGFIIAILIFMFFPPFNDWSWNSNANLFSDYGNFVSGLFGTILALGSVILIYLTFREQQSQFEKLRTEHQTEYRAQVLEQNQSRDRQIAFFERERFENRLFEMFRSNREIIQQMVYEVPDECCSPHFNNYDKANKPRGILISGQSVLVQIHKHINYAQAECRWIFDDIISFDDLFADSNVALKEKRKLQSYYKGNVDDSLMKTIHWLGIIYLCIFFGVREDGIKMLRPLLKINYNHELIEKVLQTLKIKPVVWSDYWSQYDLIREKTFRQIAKGENIEYLNKDYNKFYGGHHHRLGHYFRNLFSIYNYINNQELKYPEKYGYAKILRSQLSTYEQSLFFYNSLCSLGKAWEIEAKRKDDRKLLDIHLITKYNIVRNISAEMLANVSLEKVYPLVEYENKYTTMKKIKLKLRYT